MKVKFFIKKSYPLPPDLLAIIMFYKPYAYGKNFKKNVKKVVTGLKESVHTGVSIMENNIINTFFTRLNYNFHIKNGLSILIFAYLEYFNLKNLCFKSN